MLFSVAILFPALTEKTLVSTRVLFEKASTVTSNISKNEFETISRSICTLSDRPSPSLSNPSIVSIDTSAGSVTSIAWTVTVAVG